MHHLDKQFVMPQLREVVIRFFTYGREDNQCVGGSCKENFNFEERCSIIKEK
jgi:hypothetical protein